MLRCHKRIFHKKNYVGSTHGVLTSQRSVGRSCQGGEHAQSAVFFVFFFFFVFLMWHPLYSLSLQWEWCDGIAFSVCAWRSFRNAAFCCFASQVCLCSLVQSQKKKSDSFSFLTVTLVLNESPLFCSEHSTVAATLEMLAT